MADFTAKDVQALRQATGAGMMDAKKALQENDGDAEAAGQVAPREGPGQGGRPLRPRQQPGHRRRVAIDGPSPPSPSSSARPTSSPSPTSSPRSSRRSPPSWPSRARRPRPRRPRPSTTSRSCSRRTSSWAGSSGSRRPRATCSTPTSTARTGAASTASSSSSTAAPPSWPTTSPCTSPSPSPPTSAATRSPRPRSPRSAQTLEAITRAEGKPEAAHATRSSRVASPAGSRSGCCSSRPTSRTRSRPSPSCWAAHRSCGSPRWSIGSCVRQPADGAERPAGLGSCSSCRVRRSPARRATASTARSSASWPSEIVDARRNLDVDVAVVVGGGNIWRGMTGAGARHGPRPGRLHGHAGHGHQRAWPCRTRSSSWTSRPGSSRPSTWPRSPSPTSGAAPSATSRRAGS